MLLQQQLTITFADCCISAINNFSLILYLHVGRVANFINLEVRIKN